MQCRCGTTLSTGRHRHWLLRLPGGAAAGCAAMLLCGVSTGMIAAALSEIIELFPTLVYRARLRRGVAALIAAFTGGKVLGAFFASL